MKHTFLVRKDDFDSRDHLAMRSGSTLPNLVTMESSLTQVFDQANSGSCTGQSGAGFRGWLQNAYPETLPAGVIRPTAFSALFLYAIERMKNGTFPSDSGSDSRTLMQVLNLTGICPYDADPFSDTLIKQVPTPAQVAAAANFKIGAYHRVLFDDGVATSKSVLASLYCHVIGIPVFKQIDSDEVAETGLLPIPGRFDTPIGGHELLVYGYDDSIAIGTSLGAHLVRNSWGATWGIGGNLRIPFDYYAAVGGNDTCDAWVGHMGKPWVPKSS